MGVKLRIHTPSSPVPSFPSSPSPSDVWSWQLGGFRIPDPSPPPRGRYIAGADATRPAARHSLREGRLAAATGGAGGGGRCSGGGAGAAAVPGPGRAWAPGGARRPGGSGAERARRLQPGPGPGDAASARGFCTVGARALSLARARVGGAPAGRGGVGRAGSGHLGRPPPRGRSAPSSGTRRPAGRLPQPRRGSLQPGPFPRSAWKPVASLGFPPWDGRFSALPGSRGSLSASLQRSSALCVCREALASGGGEGG